MDRLFAVGLGLVVLIVPASARADGGPDVMQAFEKCKIVSDDPSIADRENGICVSATRDFVAALRLPADAASNQALADLIGMLSQLPWHADQRCDGDEDEIPEAMRIASQALVDQEQAVRIRELADLASQTCGTGPSIPVNVPASAD